MKNYRYWKWKKDNYKNIKSQIKTQRFDNEKIKDEIEKEIINMEENKKELCNERLFDRQLIKQNTVNPFLSNNNYINDLMNQDNFLRPKDSNIDDKNK